MGSHGQNKGAMILVLLIVVIVIVLVAYHGISTTTTASTSKPSVFTVSSTAPSGQIYQGKSSDILFNFYNPFNQSITANVSLALGAPGYVSTSTPSRIITMPANMPSISSSYFNITCTNGPEQSTYSFFVQIPSFWQNITTSVITYPYDTAQNLRPIPIYKNNGQGFMSVSANTLSIPTQIPDTVPQGNIAVSFANATYAAGEPYTSISHGTANDYVSDIIVSISNSSSDAGISSAFIFYNGQKIYLTSSSNGLLSVNLPNVYMPLLSTSGLPIEIVARNTTSATQDLVNIDVHYNYLFSVAGSPSVIDCG